MSHPPSRQLDVCSRRGVRRASWLRSVASRWFITRAVLPLALTTSCEDVTRETPEPVKASPNATIVPAPLLSGRKLVSKPRATSPSPRTTSASTKSLSPEPEVDTAFSYHGGEPSDTTAARASTGLLLEAFFEWPKRRTRDVHLHEAPRERIEDANQAIRRKVLVDLYTEDRMRLELATNAFPLEVGTSFLAKKGRAGHLLLWPNQRSYRVVPQGSVRALFRERRLDVTPQLVAEVIPGPTGKRFGVPSEVTELSTAHGQLRLEQVEVDGLGHGGALLCRFLLEFVAASPATVACGRDLLPVLADFRFPSEGELRFRVADMAKKAETPTLLTQVPPQRARHVRDELPALPDSILDRRWLPALARPTEPQGTLTVRNRTLFAAYLVANDVPLLLLEPKSKKELDSLPQVEFSLSSTTFFGEELLPPAPFTPPGSFSIGTAVKDAGP